MPQHSKSATSVIFFAALVILACLLLSACDSNPLPMVTPTVELNTIATPSVVASLPETPSPITTPLATEEAADHPLGLIIQAIDATSNVDRLHFVITLTTTLTDTDTTKEEGYVVAPSDAYTKFTRADGPTVEHLKISDKYYRLPGAGKWEGIVPPASMPTPDPTLTRSATFIRGLLSNSSDIASLWTLVFKYKGEQSVDGKDLLYFVGQDYAPGGGAPSSISLWIDPGTTLVHKLTHSWQPPSGSIEEEVLLDRFNDPSITIPSP